MAIVVTGLSNRPSKRGRWYYTLYDSIIFETHIQESDQMVGRNGNSGMLVG